MTLLYIKTLDSQVYFIQISKIAMWGAVGALIELVRTLFWKYQSRIIAGNDGIFSDAVSHFQCANLLSSISWFKAVS